MKILIHIVLLLVSTKLVSGISIPLPSAPVPSGVNSKDKTPYQAYSKNHQENVNVSSLALDIQTIDLEAPGRQLNLIVQKSYSSSPSEVLSVGDVLGNNWFLSVNGINALFGADFSGGYYNTLHLRQSSGSVYTYTVDYTDGDIVYYKRNDLKWESESHRKGKYIDTTKNKLMYNTDTHEYIYKTVDSVNYYFSSQFGDRINMTKIMDIYGNIIQLYYNANQKLEKIKDTLNREYMFYYNAEGMLDHISAYQQGGTTYQHSKYRYSEGKLIEYEDAENRVTKYIYESDNKRIRQIVYPSGGRTEYEYTTLKQDVEINIFYHQGTLSDKDWAAVRGSMGYTHARSVDTQDMGKYIVQKRKRIRFSSTNIKETTEYQKNIRYSSVRYMMFTGSLVWGEDQEGNEIFGQGTVTAGQTYNELAMSYNYTIVKDQQGYQTKYYADSSGSIIRTENPSYSDSKGNTYQEITFNDYVYSISNQIISNMGTKSVDQWYKVTYTNGTIMTQQWVVEPGENQTNGTTVIRYTNIEKLFPVVYSTEKVVHYTYLMQPKQVTQKLKVNGTEHVINVSTSVFDENFNITNAYNSIDNHEKKSRYDYKEDAKDDLSPSSDGFIYNRVIEKWEQNQSHNKTMTIKVKLIYDDYGNIKEIQKNINGNMEKLTEYEYDSTYPGNLIKITDANANTTEYEYTSQYQYAYPSKTIKKLDGNTIQSKYIYDFYTGNIMALEDYKGNRTEYKYDKLNRLIHTKNPDGSIKEINYSTSLQRSETIVKTDKLKVLQRSIKYYGDLGKVLTQSVEDGQDSETFNKVRYEYNERGELIKKIDDPENHKVTTEYFYDGTGRLKKIQFPDGAKKTYLYYYDVANKFRISEETSYPTDNDADKQTIIKYYDYKNQLLKIEYPQVEANGTVQVLSTEYEYDEIGNQTHIQDANGNIKKIYYDEFNRKTKIIYPDNTYISNTYDLLGNITKKRDPNEYTTELTYNEQYKVKKIKDPMSYETEYKYDANGNKIQEIDAKGNSTYYEYDKKNRLIKVIDSLGYYVQYQYDQMDNKVKEIDKKGNTTQYTYDGLKRLIKVKNAQGEEIHTEYNDLNQKVSQTDSKENKTYFYYDKMNRVTKTKDALGNYNYIEYDYLGNKKKVQDSMNRIVGYKYDKLNRLSEVSNAYYTVQYKYDALGNKIREIDGEGNAQTWAYDRNNRVVTINDAKGFQTSYQYDKLDNVTRIRDKSYNYTYYEYDKNYRKTKERTADNKEIKYEYDEVGNLIKKTDESGNQILYKYNNRYELTNVNKPEGRIRYIYDAEGNVIEVDDETGKEKYYYDALNRLIEKKLEYTKISTNENMKKGYRIRQEYDANGNVSKIILPSGAEVDYKYNKNNWMKEVQAFDERIAEYQYDRSGKNTETLLGNSVRNIYRYDKAGRLKDQEVWGKHRQGSANVEGILFGEYYIYDKANNRIKKKDYDGEYTKYSYDKNYQLTGVDYEHNTKPGYDQEYTYDPMGNRLTMKYKYGKIDYSYNDKNYELKKYKINQHGNVQYEYDKRGNTIRKINLTGTDKKNEFRYTFDSENRLIKVWHKRYDIEKKLKGTEEAEKAVTEMTYHYNSAGMRIGVKEPGKTNNIQETRYYIYSGNNVIAELNDEGKITTEFIYGIEKVSRIEYPQPIKADSITEDNPPTEKKLTYLHADPIGSASLITDDEGYLLQEYHYDAFGSIIFSRGSDGNRYRFAGKEYDQETGLSYFGARFYDPITGRFISEDPVRSDFSTITHNPYPYAGNNPYKYVDPNGEFLLLAAAVAGVLGGIHAGTEGTWNFDDFNWTKAFAGGMMAFTAVYSFGSSIGSGFGIEALGGTAGKGLFATGKIISGTLGIAGSSYGMVSTIIQIESGEGLTMGTGLSALATFGFSQFMGAGLSKGASEAKRLRHQLFTAFMSTDITFMIRAGADGASPTADELLRSFGMSLGITAVYAGASALDTALMSKPVVGHDAVLSESYDPESDSDIEDRSGRIFKISKKNIKSNAVYAIVQKGDTLRDIAKTYGLTTHELLELNPQIQNPDMVYSGEFIRVNKIVFQASLGITVGTFDFDIVGYEQGKGFTFFSRTGNSITAIGAGLAIGYKNTAKPFGDTSKAAGGLNKYLGYTFKQDATGRTLELNINLGRSMFSATVTPVGDRKK